MSSIDRQQHIEKILRDLIDLLPDSYNKEVTDTNYYKLLRSLALELSDTKVQVDAVRKNNYLETVGPDAIQNNFGTLVKLEKLPEWDDEKYRDLVKGVIQSLLIGPTKNSLIQAFKMFTSFDVKVHELYKDSDKVDPSVYEGYNKKFTFLLEIEKPLDVFADNKVLQRDANYIIGILKPAHTIGLQIINLTDSEDFRLYYGIDKKVNNLSSAYTEEKIINEINKLISQKLTETISKHAIDNNVSLDVASDTIYIRNYGVTKSKYEDSLKQKGKELYDKYSATFDKKDTNLNVNEGLIKVLELKHFNVIATADSHDKYPIEKALLDELKQTLYIKSNSSLTLTKLKQKINLEKEKLKEIYLRKGHDPSLISDSEWEKRTIESLKVDLLREHILEILGGKHVVYAASLKEADKFRDDYEQLYDNYTPYFGMDNIEVESNSDNNDGKFGWKHISYAGQLTTSISMKGSKIGGTDLIGPRYTLYDNHSLDSVNQYSEKIDLKSHAIFQLNKSTLNGKFILNSNNEKDVETSWARMPNEDEYKPANMEEDVTDIDVDLTDTYEFANIGFVLASGMLNVTNYAIEEVEKYEAKLDLTEESYDSINRTKDVSDINMENQDVIDILGIENEDDIVIEQELSDDFYMSPTRGFMLNVDALGNMNVIPSSLVSPEKIEKEVELTEFIGLSSKNYTPFKLNSATLNNSSGSILGTFKFDTAEGFLSKIDSNGNEIILETRVM